MALEEYRRKRDFRKTPEPRPVRHAARNKRLGYLIQKHDATRLHYDFRLELDGVLLSWAVTRGPSLNPADKRLAVRTEDHPISYGSFEGTIPKGEYGGGTVMLWDEGTWKPKGDPRAGLKKGHLSFELNGQRLKGGWALIRMRGEEKRENWLLVKENDPEAVPKGDGSDFLEEHSTSVKTDRTMEEIAGTSLAPMKEKNRSAQVAELNRLEKRHPGVQLATLVERPPEGKQWVHEIKLDGYRLLGFLSGGSVRLRTRNGQDWTRKFETIAGSLQDLKAKDAVLDMEVVALDADGRSSFQKLQAALGKNSSEKTELTAFVFDLVELDGRDLTKLPLIERKRKLEGLLQKSKLEPTIRFSQHVAGNGEAMFQKACEMGLEGIISKIQDAPYVDGRHRGWLKSKCGKRQELVILGYSAARSGGRALGALYLGYRHGGKLSYAGKVGTGFSMKRARDLVMRLKELTVREPVLKASEMTGLPEAERQAIRWVKPTLLCEVAFTEWTDDGRVRHPSFQGLREDKDAKEVEKEEPMPIVKETDGLVLSGITITHPDRVVSKTGAVTKGDIAEYYATAAPFMLPGIVNRPLSLLRCPSGIDSQCFYQRNPGKGLGQHVRPYTFKHKGKTYEYLYIEDERGLLEIVQMGSIEIHPWGARIDAIDYPDRLIFDLDPAPDVSFEALKLATMDLRKRLKGKGLESVLKCTGGKGLHLTVPLDGKDKWPEVKAFAASLAGEMVEAAPDAYVATMTKAKRTGKIFIDYFRNDYTATAIADYSVRARPGAPVAVPLRWTELKSLTSPSQFTLEMVRARLKGKKPETITAEPQSLPAK